MRKLSLGVGMLALIAVGACHKKDAASDDLAADLARVSGTDGLALAPSSAGRSTVSAVEQVAPHFHVAKSRRATPHRTPHVDRTSPTIAPVSVPVDNTPTSTVTAPVAETPVGASPRPHPADIPAPSTGDGPGPGDGGTGTSGRGGIGIGGILGGIGVILRGGSAGDDHCDPRPYPRGGRPPIDMGRTIPIIRY